ncbi:ankyrin-3-like [Trichogramma pretiosum]|uniref:ankyrin-3-like n=1 Tax=Trichogramma pretiosum TaxID=7493 RepID=UPI0006C948BB|nr:ankyrin-3-like [Trichogramma pretiosum]
MAQDNENYFDKLKSLREQVNWEIEYDRHELLRQLYPIVRRWKGRLPNLRNIFRAEEIECLLTDSVNLIYNKNERYIRQGELIAKFVARSGYRDEPKVDKDGKTSTRRTTPIHHAARSWFSHCETMAGALFQIYSDVNYVDEKTNMTHFHAACLFGCVKVARKFLELGQDPNGLVSKTGDSALHLALWRSRKKVVKLLLRRGADPNLPNHYGYTALHSICLTNDRDGLAELLFEICDERGREVLVDARNREGRTALHMALARNYRDTAELLLRRGADPNSVDAEGLTPLHVIAAIFWADKLAELFFDVNAELGQRSYFVMDWPRCPNETCDHFKLRQTSAALIIVQLLEQRGYELDRSGALTIMRHFARYDMLETLADYNATYEFFGKSDLDEYRYDDEFASEAKKITIVPSLSLNDLIQLPAEEAEKRVGYEDYFEFARSGKLFHSRLINISHVACVAHLCELITRRFFRRWSLDPFWELIRKRLPLEICEMVLDQLGVKDLCSICLAAAGPSS